ncbi:TonB-dependent receptor [Persicobacter diffluens]|uniref:TonB-dependent receptor n=1 Tax=Persicobacter diffluens TaxID=981 RepID=A0AAN4W1L3_9BACT|nr:TonB-dependent receptor [Persicobacter diffluens]
MSCLKLILTLLLSFSVSSLIVAADFGDIHGVVKNEKGEPLVGIALSIKGTSLGGATDIAGRFHLHHVPVGSAEIEVRGLGYKPSRQLIQIQAGTQLELDIVLKEDVLGLEQVVVSANREAINRREAAVPVQVVGVKMFESTQSVTLLDGLKYQPGIRVESNCQSCGFSQVRMNGLEGGYSQVLIDGRPVFSALNGIHGLEQMPTTMIERVEVIRGGGSSLYGGNAIAGTINVITKEPNFNEFEIGTNMGLIGGSSLDQTYSFGGNLVSDDLKRGISLYGFHRKREQWDLDGDGFSELPQIKNYTLGFKGFLKPSDYSKISLEGSAIKESRRGGSDFDRPPHEADLAEQFESDVFSGGLTFDQFTHDMQHKFSFYLSNQNTQRDNYSGAGQDPEGYGKTENNNLVTGLRYTTNQPFLGGSTALTAGVEYKNEYIRDTSQAYERVLDQRVSQVGYYAQSDWQVNDRLKVLAGFRIEQLNLIDLPVFVPRVNVKYDMGEGMRLRAGYARGFRAPQAFDEDLHVELVNGMPMVTYLADDLKPEYSDSFTGSLDFDREWGTFDFNLTIDAFYTKITNTFVNIPIGEENGVLVREKRNGEGSQVRGISITPSIANAYMTLQAGMTFQKSTHNEAQDWWADEEQGDRDPVRQYLRTPDLYGFFAMTVRPIKNFAVDFSGNYTGRMYVTHFESENNAEDRLVHTPDFLEMNVKLSYDMKIRNSNTLQWSIGVKNITNAYQQDVDSGMDRDSDYVYGPMLPRTYFAGLKIKI